MVQGLLADGQAIGILYFLNCCVWAVAHADALAEGCCIGVVITEFQSLAVGSFLIVGGLLGGVLFGLAILCMNLGLLVNIESVYDKAVPSLVLADNIHRAVGVVFSVILICGIYTTAVPMLWGVTSQFAQEKTKKFMLVALVLTVIAFFLGMTDFKVLVNTIYPFSGYMGIILMVVVLYHMLFDKRDKKEVGAALNEKYKKLEQQQ